MSAPPKNGQNWTQFKASENAWIERLRQHLNETLTVDDNLGISLEPMIREKIDQMQHELEVETDEDTRDELARLIYEGQVMLGEVAPIPVHYIDLRVELKVGGDDGE